MSIQTINPATGKLIKEYGEMPHKEVMGIIDDCHKAYLQWREVSFAERSKCMKKAAQLLKSEKEKYGKIITEEMGKPITAAMGEIEKCAWVCEHYAEHAENYLKPRQIKTEMQKSYVAYKPTGVIFAIMPWNFPFWQVFRFAAPNIMGGNVGILKHAPISTGAALAIEQIFEDAGFPKNIFRSLVIDTDEASQVIAHPKVAAVTLTGSEGAGKVVGSEAARNLKKVVLELGGSDPYLILEDADLDLAAEQCVKSRMNNSGQVCISAKRMIIVDKIADEFEKKVLQKLNEVKMGDPMDPNINFGPIAREDLRDLVAKQVEESIAKGAECILGGKPESGEGFYYPPTVLKNVKPNMPAYDEEIFGPVISFIRVKDENEAIDVANATRFGLAGAVFTKDIARGEAIARDKIVSGTVNVNVLVGSDPRLPFGGTKSSGYGRELAAEGIHEFMNVKTISVR